MKKFILGFLIGAIVFSAIGVFGVSYVAKPVDFKVLVNGEEFISDPPALEIEGRTYLPLRAMGEALGVPVSWNEELRQAEVGNSAPVANKNEYSRSNPAPINTVQTYTKSSEYFEEDNYTVAVRIVETLRGVNAWEKIKTANMFNSEAPAGYEYVLAKIAFSVVDTKGEFAVKPSSYNFVAYSSNNEEMPTPFVVEPSPELEGNLYVGGNAEGYLVFLVKSDDASPKLAYGLDYNGAGGIWFKLQ